MASSSSPPSSWRRTPPLASSSPTSFALNSSQPESVATPCSSVVSFCQGRLDDSDDSDDEENWGLIAPRTPSRRRRRRISGTQKTPSCKEVLLVKGNVTPSRAAPLFARFTAKRRASSRVQLPSVPSSSHDDMILDSPSSPTFGRGRRRLKADEQSQFIEADWANHPSNLCSLSDPPPLNLSVSHRAATADVSSYMLALRTNSAANLPSTSAFRGFYGGGVAGSGVLGGCRTLGAGYGSKASISYKSLHQSLTTTSTPMYDLFTLASMDEQRDHTHPLCARYSHSSRCLSQSQAQWLAVGDNEGKLTLINTLRDIYTFEQQYTASPVWTACVGSVFELAWRHDDEVIATGGSDYMVRTWDTQTGEQLRCFGGLRGSPRSIAWDSSNGGGDVFVSGGRDGAIHVFDARVAGRSEEGVTDPVLSIWGAHTSLVKRNPRQKHHPKGVTSLAYVPGRGNGVLASAGCADGILKLWDLRSAHESGRNIDVDEAAKATAEAATPRKGGKKKKTKPLVLDPIDEGIDLTAVHGHNKSTHGVSSLVVSSTHIYSACTDGRVYTSSLSDLSSGSSSTSLGIPSPALFDAATRTNSLYARLALHDDERSLALGCHSGKVAIWDAFASLNTPPCTERGLGEATILTAHNFEINGLDWASGPNGPTLATVSDDQTIRTWQTK